MPSVDPPVDGGVRNRNRYLRWFASSLPASGRHFRLNPSGLTLKADGHIIAGHDDRHFANPLRVFQHFIHIGRRGQHIDVFDILPLFCQGFTSRSGVRSRIFPEDQNIVRHLETSFSLVTVPPPHAEQLPASSMPL